jgi:hypothetical protein
VAVAIPVFLKFQASDKAVDARLVNKWPEGNREAVRGFEALGEAAGCLMVQTCSALTLSDKPVAGWAFRRTICGKGVFLPVRSYYVHRMEIPLTYRQHAAS